MTPFTIASIMGYEVHVDWLHKGKHRWVIHHVLGAKGPIMACEAAKTGYAKSGASWTSSWVRIQISNN